MKCVLLVVFTSIMAGNLYEAKAQHEQASQKGWYISPEAGAASMHTIDEKFSVARFSGIAFVGALGISYHRPRFSHFLHARWLSGVLLSDPQPEKKMHQSQLNFSYEGLYCAAGTTDTRFQLHAGGTVNVLYAKRNVDAFINDHSNFDFACSVGPLVELTGYFEHLFRGVRISERVAVPVVSAILRPASAFENSGSAVDAPHFQFQSFTNSGRISGFSSFLRVNSKLSLEKDISQNDRLSLSYTWDYYSFREVAIVKSVAHQVTITYTIKL